MRGPNPAAATWELITAASEVFDRGRRVRADLDASVARLRATLETAQQLFDTDGRQPATRPPARPGGSGPN